MSDADKSRLLNKQRDEMAVLIKAVKKSKGAYKVKAQKKVEEAEARHAAELAELMGEVAIKEAAPDEAPAADDKPAHPVLPWASLSRKELESECTKRGLGKKGNAEELRTKLTLWEGEQRARFGDAAVDAATEAAAAGDDDADDDDDGSASSDDGGAAARQSEEAARFAKREKVVQSGIVRALETHPLGFATDDIASVLADVGIKSFTPAIVGYDNVHDFLRNQPKTAGFFYDRNAKKILRPKAQKR